MQETFQLVFYCTEGDIMRIYCDRVEQTDGRIHRKELDHMVNW